MPVRKLVPSYGAAYEGAIDLAALRRAHRPRYRERTRMSVDGNTAAAIPFVQWWRAPIMAGFPITPATKWLEHLSAEVASGKLDVDIGGKTVRAKKVKQLESEHAAADYIGGVAAACRDLIVGTATSSVGLDHMTESVRSLGASGLGNIVLVNVSRATANYPLCIEGDTSDTLGHRDDGFIQVYCRGKQQIYDTLLQLPAIGMNPRVLTPTMPAFCGIKDSHRVGGLTVEPDDEVNDFLDAALAARDTLPSLLDGDTAMGNCVTSAWFQGFKVDQKRRQRAVFDVLPRVAAQFQQRFGRPGIQPLELFGMEDAEVALVAMGPDAGTAVQLLPRMSQELGARVGLVVVRLLTPFPGRAVATALAKVGAIGVVNAAHHHGRGHLTLDVSDALSAAGPVPPIEAFFCGLGGADVSVDSWLYLARITVEAARRGRAAMRWRIVHDGVEVLAEEV